ASRRAAWVKSLPPGTRGIYVLILKRDRHLDIDATRAIPDPDHVRAIHAAFAVPLSRGNFDAGLVQGVEEIGRMLKGGHKSVQLPEDTRPDVRFVFDFNQLNFNSGDAEKDAALRVACDSFVKTTRDQIYPILRDITGVYVGKHCKEIRYT